MGTTGIGTAGRGALRGGNFPPTETAGARPLGLKRVSPPTILFIGVGGTSAGNAAEATAVMAGATVIGGGTDPDCRNACTKSAQLENRSWATFARARRTT